MELTGKTEEIILVRYRAIKYDNYQGGSGMPFEDKLVFNVDACMNLIELKSQVNQMLEMAVPTQFIGEVDLISIEII
jgi:hypothetical protein